MWHWVAVAILGLSYYRVYIKIIISITNSLNKILNLKPIDQQKGGKISITTSSSHDDIKLNKTV